MTSPRRGPIHDKSPCSEGTICPIGLDRELTKRLQDIEKELAVMNENWIKLERFLRLEGDVKALSDKLKWIGGIVFGFCALILVAMVKLWIDNSLKGGG